MGTTESDRPSPPAALRALRRASSSNLKGFTLVVPALAGALVVLGCRGEGGALEMMYAQMSTFRNNRQKAVHACIWEETDRDTCSIVVYASPK